MDVIISMQFRYSTDVMAWVSNYNPLFYMDIITYPCPDPDAGFDDQP